MRKFISILLVLATAASLPLISVAQRSNERVLDIDAAIGNTEGTLSASYSKNWHFGKKNNFVVGLGVRSTAYFGANRYYITAPAKLTSGSTGPLVLFKENIVQNIDTFLIAKPQVVAANAMVNLGYQFTEKFQIGFNIDLIGLSVGSEKKGNYINGSNGQNVASKPSSFNLLLISDNDLGSLNSELYATYMLTEKLGIRGGMQFLFTEYTTDTAVQQFPQANDRFRYKSLMFMLGARFRLDK